MELLDPNDTGESGDQTKYFLNGTAWPKQYQGNRAGTKIFFSNWYCLTQTVPTKLDGRSREKSGKVGQKFGLWRSCFGTCGVGWVKSGEVGGSRTKVWFVAWFLFTQGIEKGRVREPQLRLLPHCQKAYAMARAVDACERQSKDEFDEIFLWLELVFF